VSSSNSGRSHVRFYSPSAAQRTVLGQRPWPGNRSDRWLLIRREFARESLDREARTVVSLNHPYVCTLHDVGRQDEINHLEMVEMALSLVGEPLAAGLATSPVPLDQVLPCAIEIADALGKAHRRGVTHRDLGSSNIALTQSSSLHRFSPASITTISSRAPHGPVYQTSFKANWICREVVAVEVI
jgi:serine/threonine protein kinase